VPLPAGARSTVAKNSRPGWELVVRRIVRAALRPWPASPVLSAIERAAPRYARLALRARGAGLPRNVRAFPAKVAPYFGTEAGPAEHARLVEARLVFLLIRAFVQQFLLLHEAGGGRRGLGPIELRGATYLEAALAERRGLLLISAHFGLPSLIGFTLRERGLPAVAVGGIMADRADVVVGRDVWAAARGMQQVRDALANKQVCVLLVDTPKGRYAEPPFLQGRIPVAAGAFRLAQLTRSPLLPVFAVHTSASPRFSVEIGPPLSVADRSSASPFAGSLAGFLRCFEAIARRHPAQLFGYEPVFGSSRAWPRSGVAPEPRSQNARP
jgi:lauroyl/myristoyl acyltransferase